MSRRETSLKRTNQELVREKAEALGRAGKRLERLLGELEGLACELRQMEDSASPEAVAQAEHRYERLRIQALEARRHLMIQRDAVGIRSHALLSELFAVPRPRRRGVPEWHSGTAPKRSEE